MKLQGYQERSRSFGKRIRIKQETFFAALDPLRGCHLAFNHLPATRVVIKDSQGKFVWVSDNVPARHGLESPDDFVGLHDRDINPLSLAQRAHVH